jgi:hypothetical protein
MVLRPTRRATGTIPRVMILRTVVRDCLYLNWALPARLLPSPPPPLRYEVLRADGEDRVFVSAVLFRQEGLRLSHLPLARLSYPQFNLRVYVLDGDGVPSVLFWRMLVPLWVVPGARLLGRQPAGGARFSYPRPSATPDAAGWRWRVRSGRELAVTAAPGGQAPGPGPSFPSREAMIDYFRRRPRGYARRGAGLARIETRHPAVSAWPVRAAIEEAGLLRACAPALELAAWPELHSAWLCPEIAFVFDLSWTPEVRLPRRVPAAGSATGVCYDPRS